ncbi:MAG TPA: PIN domain-containing protein [Thermoplasmata archaeon]|nr:PIN domain-containing protein [Nitrososphaerales archaeon]HEV2519995.1 PIN domain-containing protein [Thermoplasmata archaeon]
MKLTVDSFAWIELIRETPVGERARDLIENTETCFTPAIVLAEVAHRCLKDGMREGLVSEELSAIGEASEIVPIDATLALSASIATTELRARSRALGLTPPGLGDGLVLATSRRTSAPILTGDRHFKDLPEAHWLV